MASPPIRHRNRRDRISSPAAGGSSTALGDNQPIWRSSTNRLSAVADGGDGDSYDSLGAGRPNRSAPTVWKSSSLTRQYPNHPPKIVKLHVDDIRQGLVQAVAHAPSGKSFPVELVPTNGTFTAKFVPAEVGR